MRDLEAPTPQDADSGWGLAEGARQALNVIGPPADAIVAKISEDSGGYAMRGEEGAIYVPVIEMKPPGRGRGGAFLDSLPRGETIKVPGVISPVLRGMLERRGFELRMEWFPELEEEIEVYVRDAQKGDTVQSEATTEVTLRPELPPLPDRMKRLKLDRRGYPVPWFVAWFDGEDRTRELRPGTGEPDFRILRSSAVGEALKYERCWICGEQLGRYRAFVIGPMCMVNRINSEPPSHLDCADYAGRACPFLARPHMRRREDNMPEDSEMPGVGILRNPGCAIVWVTKEPVTIKRVPNGILFNLPEPSELRFYAEGRQATFDEVADSISSGLPALIEVCGNEEERQEVERLAAEALARRVAPVLLPGTQAY